MSRAKTQSVKWPQYIAHNSLRKLYPNAEQILRDLLASRADFMVRGEVKDQDIILQITAKGNKVAVEVTEENRMFNQGGSLRRDLPRNATFEAIIDAAVALTQDIV